MTTQTGTIAGLNSTANPQPQAETRGGLGLDAVALIALLLIAILHHIQSPLLQFEVDFGKAFRNETLQPALALGLLVCGWVLMRGRRVFSLPLVYRAAALVLAVYVIYILLAVILHINLLGLVFGLPQEAFLERVRDEALIPTFTSALNISNGLAFAAMLAVVVLWSPWLRLPLYARAVRQNAPALIVAVLVLVLWEGLIVLLNIQQFLLPRPSVIATTFMENYSKGLISVGWNTFQNAFWGFILGCGAGILTGIVSARFSSFSQALLPLAIAANSIPIIAFAPIMNNWFGALNPFSKIAIVAVLTYFPAMISTVKGLTSIQPTALELMDSYAASPMEIFRKLRFPNSLPYIFNALKVATTLSMIGAIVSEYFGGSTQGLGYRIREDAALFKYAESWAAIIVAAVLGIAFYLLVSAVERALMPWHVGFRDDET